MRRGRKRRAPGREAFKRKVKARQMARRGRTALLFGELKFHDLDINDSVIATGANIVQDSCNLIVQGITESQRIGRKCVVRNINWHFRFSLPATSVPGDTSDTVRIILYQDKQANGATATTTGILETADYQSFNNLANKSRFRTLMDRTYSLSAKSGAFDGTNDQFGEVNIHDTFFKAVNIALEFDAALGAITELRSNNIGVMLLSRAGVAGFSSTMRLRFSDN